MDPQRFSEAGTCAVAGVQPGSGGLAFYLVQRASLPLCPWALVAHPKLSGSWGCLLLGLQASAPAAAFLSLPFPDPPLPFRLSPVSRGNTIALFFRSLLPSYTTEVSERAVASPANWEPCQQGGTPSAEGACHACLSL